MVLTSLGLRFPICKTRAHIRHSKTTLKLLLSGGVRVLWWLRQGQRSSIGNEFPPSTLSRQGLSYVCPAISRLASPYASRRISCFYFSSGLLGFQMCANASDCVCVHSDDQNHAIRFARQVLLPNEPSCWSRFSYFHAIISLYAGPSCQYPRLQRSLKCLTTCRNLLPGLRLAGFNISLRDIFMQKPLS